MTGNEKKNDLAFIAMIVGMFFLFVWFLKLFIQAIVWYFRMLVAYPIQTIAATALVIGIAYFGEYSTRKEMSQELVAMQSELHLLPKEQKDWNEETSKALESAKNLDFGQRIDLIENEKTIFLKKFYNKPLKGWKGILKSIDHKENKIHFNIEIPGITVNLNNGNSYDEVPSSVHLSGSTPIGKFLLTVPEGSYLRFSGQITRKKKPYEDIYDYYFKLTSAEKW